MRVTVRRLNKNEYNNTIRDLFGIAIRPADTFGIDPSGLNFDNNSDVLSIDGILAGKYLDASQTIANEVFKTPSKFMICSPSATLSAKACARKILGAIAKRAYRRPISELELVQLETVVDVASSQGDGFEKAIYLGIQKILMSPNFLFRIEKHSAPDNPNVVVQINDYELATRLSYFIWSSMPDDTLFALAATGSLKNSSVLKEQVNRMLKDSKAQSLVDIFASQWLDLSSLSTHDADMALFPALTAKLKDDMLIETKSMIASVFRGTASVSDFVKADYTFINENLANHYGISAKAVDGKTYTADQFRKVSLVGTERRGLITQGSLLTITSHANETSPVIRGKWVMENLMCSAPPEPPSNISLGNPPEGFVGTRRQRIEYHSKNPTCYSCHSVMDPIGFSLEKLNPIGQWRTTLEGDTIDDTGKLPDGKSFAGATGLADLLDERPQFKTCFSKKITSFALGRELKPFENCRIQNLALANIDSKKTFADLVYALVTNDIFLKQKGDGGI